MILRDWFIYIFDIINYKNYFFNMRIYFDNNFYFTKFIYLFHVQNLNTFVNFKTPVVERWLIQTSHRLLFLSGVLFMIDCTTAQVRWWGRWPTTEVWHYFLYDINVSRPIFVKLDNYFNPGCLYPTFVEKKLFPMEQMKLKWPSIKLNYDQLDRFFVFPIVFTFIF